MASLSQLSGTKKEKDGEDKKRNPILKYIGKPRNSSQSSKYKHTCARTHSVTKLQNMRFVKSLLKPYLLSAC